MNQGLRLQRLTVSAKKRATQKSVFIILFVLLLAAALWWVLRLHHSNVSATSTQAVRKAVVTAVISPLPTTPADWQTYDSPYGFSFEYPATWSVDDSYLTPFSTLHKAFAAHSNYVTVYGNQVAETDPTQGPSVTISVAALSDEETLLHATFSTPTAWLASSVTGLPSGAQLSNIVINGEPAVRLTGLHVLLGKYEVIYYIDPTKKEVVRFDYTYPNDSDVNLLDTITGSFTFH